MSVHQRNTLSRHHGVWFTSVEGSLGKDTKKDIFCNTWIYQWWCVHFTPRPSVGSF